MPVRFRPVAPLNDMTELTINFKSQFCNGWPQIKIYVDSEQIVSHDFTEVQEHVNFNIPSDHREHVISIERYGKTADNMVFHDQNIVQDQILEIMDIRVDGVKIPEYILDQHTRFEFQDQVHTGSRFFGPNGIWYLPYHGSLVTWILDQKIIHEAQYNQDYEFPWSYKLGPHSVNTIIDEVTTVLDKVNNTKFND